MPRISLADADAVFSAAMTEGLAMLGYDVRTFRTGAEAAAAALVEPPDAAVIALELPDMRGTTLCRWFKSCPQTTAIPLIVVAASASEEDLSDGFASGAESVVLKPIGLRELQLRLRILLPTRPPRMVGVNGTRDMGGHHPSDWRKLN